ncbi:MAG: YcgN family cysteine cluster protein [Gammaproteobacteria bacterium]|nr:YcgN family cysteine cluster protein [Gammaproteobacteria bacterium]MCW8909433.1 YcgN family cysteine cluster protein [Gammaproteobacteria bacterium]
MNLPFWQAKSLFEMNKTEWESLCDGCAQCCLVKLEDEETGDLYMTNVACHLLDIQTCRCTDYEHRLEKVSMCLSLSIEEPETFKWLPETCAYRRLSEGKDLMNWHPLLSNNNESVHQECISVRDFAQSEEYIHVDQLPDHVIEKIS